MTSQPPTTDLPDSAHAHPAWCDLSRCGHPDALEARGQTEADIPPYLRDAHLSRVWTVPSPSEETVIEAWCWNYVYAPVTDAISGVDLRITTEQSRTVLIAPLEPSQVRALAEAFVELRDLIDGHHVGGAA